MAECSVKHEHIKNHVVLGLSIEIFGFNSVAILAELLEFPGHPRSPSSTWLQSVRQT